MGGEGAVSPGNHPVGLITLRNGDGQLDVAARGIKLLIVVEGYHLPSQVEVLPGNFLVQLAIIQPKFLHGHLLPAADNGDGFRIHQPNGVAVLITHDIARPF